MSEKNLPCLDLTFKECNLLLMILSEMVHKMNRIPNTPYLITGSSTILDTSRGCDEIFNNLYEKVKSARFSFEKEADA